MDWAPSSLLSSCDKFERETVDAKCDDIGAIEALRETIACSSRSKREAIEEFSVLAFGLLKVRCIL